VSSVRPDRPALLLAIAIAAAIFAVSFGFVADADRTAPTAAAAPRAPRHEPASPRVGLAPAPSLRVSASLLVRPAAPARRARVAPPPAPAASAPSTPPDGVPEEPAGPSAPVDVAPPSPSPSPSPPPAQPTAKPRPKPAAKPKTPNPPDFDDTGPAAPGKGRAVGG
jgi:neural Wiskott-Aldrich syndrome protein